MLLASSLVGAPAAAQQPPPTTPDASKAGPAEKPEKEKFFRKNTVGIGPGFVFWPPQHDDPADKYEIAPALSLQTRRAFPIAGPVGFEWTNDVVFHDWKAMGDAYNWYFKEDVNADGDDVRPLKIGLLWPGLIFIPFGGANYETGFGFVFWTAQNVPSVYFDVGFNMALYLRLSDPKFRADFGIGAYGGVGFDLAKNIGANLRVMWGTPFIHTLIRKSSGGITTITLNINFAH